ncbi:TPA: RHS repeat-associated core domain-containing protein, partial [Pseudomonas putida]
GSNRAMVKGHSLTPETGFLAGGLQKQLADGRALQWLADNQLGKVTPVSRVDGDDDSERYHYADGGTRTRKVHTAQASAGMQTTITTYAGGCEVRQRWLAGQDAPQKHIVITEAGGVRVVENRLTGTVHLRYRFTDHLTSVGGETDESGTLISREEYAPYGGTVGRDEAAEEASNLTQRTMRYSGKEQDATGLYYYGWRYYQTELGRWLSADPGGLIDGVNLFQMCQNCPVNRRDLDGRMPPPPPPPPPRRPTRRDVGSVRKEMLASRPTMAPVPSGTTGESEAEVLRFNDDEILRLADHGNITVDRLAGATQIKVYDASHVTRLVELDGKVVMHKKFDGFAMAGATGAEERTYAKREFFAWKFSDALGMNIVPPVALVVGDPKQIVVEYVNGARPPKEYKRQDTPLYIFDYLLAMRDRRNNGGNVLRGEDEKLYAIDHESTLMAGYVPFSKEEVHQDSITRHHLDVFFESADWGVFDETDWSAFWDEHGPQELNSDQAKKEFLMRIAFVKSKMI